MRLLVAAMLVAACGGPSKPTTGPTTPSPDGDPAPDPAKTAAEHLALGAELWAASCPAAVHGLCIAKSDVRAAPGTTCASYQLDSVTSNIAAVPRDANQAAAAVEHFEAAIALDDPEVEITDARLALIDREFERALAHPFPTDLDFARDPDGSRQRFDTWFADTTALLARANDGYRALSTHGSLAASYRMGALTQWFADQLFQAPVPAELQADATLSQAYCDAMFDQAEPLEARALATFRACVAVAEAAGATDEWAKQCRVELQELDPTWAP